MRLAEGNLTHPCPIAPEVPGTRRLGVGISNIAAVYPVVVGWVEPTDVRPWNTVGFTHPTIGRSPSRNGLLSRAGGWTAGGWCLAAEERPLFVDQSGSPLHFAPLLVDLSTDELGGREHLRFSLRIGSGSGIDAGRFDDLDPPLAAPREAALAPGLLGDRLLGAGPFLGPGVLAIGEAPDARGVLRLAESKANPPPLAVRLLEALPFPA
jgi:hypothetical protein